LAFFIGLRGLLFLGVHMMDKHSEVAKLLMDIEQALRELRLWDSETPTADALASTEPFAVDRLNFPQWLQFIFIPRLCFVVAHRLALPNQCGVAPMAEQYFQPLRVNSAPVIACLQKIDSLLSHTRA
jgi:uncharacterized protein YqcC (DUF446 family)